MLLVDGVGYIQIGNNVDPMEHLKPVYIPPQTIHRLIADAFHDCLIIEISSSELDDIVRLDDDYGR